MSINQASAYHTDIRHPGQSFAITNKKLSPEQYRAKYGRCPAGTTYDGLKRMCAAAEGITEEEMSPEAVIVACINKSKPTSWPEFVERLERLEKKHGWLTMGTLREEGKKLVAAGRIKITTEYGQKFVQRVGESARHTDTRSVRELLEQDGPWKELQHAIDKTCLMFGHVAPVWESPDPMQFNPCIQHGELEPLLVKQGWEKQEDVDTGMAQMECWAHEDSVIDLLVSPGWTVYVQPVLKVQEGADAMYA